MDHHQTQDGAEQREELEHVLKMRSKYCLVFVRNIISAFITVAAFWVSDFWQKTLTVFTLNIVGGFGELGISNLIKTRGRRQNQDQGGDEHPAAPGEFRVEMVPIR